MNHSRSAIFFDSHDSPCRRVFRIYGKKRHSNVVRSGGDFAPCLADLLPDPFGFPSVHFVVDVHGEFLEDLIAQLQKSALVCREHSNCLSWLDLLLQLQDDSSNVDGCFTKHESNIFKSRATNRTLRDSPMLESFSLRHQHTHTLIIISQGKNNITAYFVVSGGSCGFSFSNESTGGRGWEEGKGAKPNSLVKMTHQRKHHCRHLIFPQESRIRNSLQPKSRGEQHSPLADASCHRLRPRCPGFCGSRNASLTCDLRDVTSDVSFNLTFQQKNNKKNSQANGKYKEENLLEKTYVTRKLSKKIKNL